MTGAVVGQAEKPDRAIPPQAEKETKSLKGTFLNKRS